VCDANNFTISMCQLPRHSGNLTLLEPSGTVQTCTGIAINVASLNCYICLRVCQMILSERPQNLCSKFRGFLSYEVLQHPSCIIPYYVVSYHLSNHIIPYQNIPSIVSQYTSYHIYITSYMVSYIRSSLISYHTIYRTT